MIIFIIGLIMFFTEIKTSSIIITTRNKTFSNFRMYQFSRFNYWNKNIPIYFKPFFMTFRYMCRITTKNSKILYSIISFNSVYMMDNFTFLKRSFQKLFHYISMLKNSFFVNFYSYISILCETWFSSFKHFFCRMQFIISIIIFSASMSLTNIFRFTNICTTTKTTNISFTHYQ